MNKKTEWTICWLGAIAITTCVMWNADPVKTAPSTQPKSIAAEAQSPKQEEPELRLVESGFQGPPFLVKFGFDEDSKGNKRVYGSAPGYTQQIWLFGPPGNRRAAIAAVDLRPDNLAQSIDFLKRTSRIIETGSSYADLDRFIESSLVRLGVRESRKIKSGECTIEFKRGSEVMAWLHVCIRKGDV